MKYIITIFASLTLSLGYAQVNQPPAPKMVFTAIIISDLDASIAWYSNTLGFKIINTTESEAHGFKQANMKMKKIQIELIEIQNSIRPMDILEDQPPKTKIGGFFKIGFAIKKFDKWLEYLKKVGVEFSGNVVKDESTGKRMLIILDPDGNRIQLFET